MSFARYRVHELVGKGGMGVVYRATDPRLDRLVALKVMAPEWSADPQFRARFLRESRLAAAIEHPQIVPVYDAGEHDGRVYLAMRYLDGGDLRSVVCAQGPLEVPRTAALAAQLASALDAAHRRGVIHRDVKPANALLAHAGGAAEHVYLADFGIARATAATTVITSAGGLIGSVMYLAPEVLEGGEASPASDRYALACLVYELLCGHPPFVADTDAAVMMAHIAREPDPPSSIRAQLGPAVDEALRWGLAKDPARRPASCAELVEALSVAGTHRLGPRSPAGSPTATLAPAPAPDGPGDSPAAAVGHRRVRAALLGAAAVLACSAIGVALGTTVAPGHPPEPGLRLQLSSASLELAGWTPVALPRDLAANLDRASARAARSPQNVVAAVGALTATDDAAVLSGPSARGPDGAVHRRLALDAVTVHETVLPSAPARETTVIERRATSGPTLAAVCRGTTGMAVCDACRFVAARLQLRGVTDLPADQPRRLAVAVRDALDDADGRLADRAALAGHRTTPRRRAAARLADAGRTAAAGLAGVEGTRAQRRLVARLASALRARGTALDAVASADGTGAERRAAQRLHDAQAELDRRVAGPAAPGSAT